MGEKFKERGKSNLGLEFEVPGIQLLGTVMIGKWGGGRGMCKTWVFRKNLRLPEVGRAQ